MHPAARVFTIAVVIVLVCSHLVLNVITDKPHFMVSRQIRQKSVNFGGMKSFNEAAVAKNADLNGDGRKIEHDDSEEKGSGQDGPDSLSTARELEGASKKPVAVAAEEVENDEKDDDIDDSEKMDTGDDCDGEDGDGKGVAPSKE